MSQLTVSSSGWSKLNFETFDNLIIPWLPPEGIALTGTVCRAWKKHSEKEGVWKKQFEQQKLPPIIHRAQVGQELQTSPGSSTLSAAQQRLVLEYAGHPVADPSQPGKLFKRAFSHPLEVYPPNIVSVFGKADWEKIKAEKPDAINWENIQFEEPPMPSRPKGGWRQVRATNDLTYHRFLYPHGITPLQLCELFGGYKYFSKEDRDAHGNTPNPDPTQWNDISITVHPDSRGKTTKQRKELLQALHSPIPRLGQGFCGLYTYREKTGIWFLGQDPWRYMLVIEQNGTWNLYLGGSDPAGPYVVALNDDYSSGVVVLREFCPPERPLALGHLAAPAKAS